MAKRPIFIPLHDGKRYVLERYVDFDWHAGFAKSQKQKSIRALHEMALREYGVNNPLEVSSKSEDPLGVALSSFNLTFTTKLGRKLTVEAAFQGSKVFELGGPFVDMFEKKPIDAKRDERLRSSGSLIRFSFFGTEWALEPKTAFYDWLYINALLKNPRLVYQVTDRDGFTDIEFNPERSINCQARSVALFCALYHTDRLAFALETKENFLSLYKGRISDPHTPGGSSLLDLIQTGSLGGQVPATHLSPRVRPMDESGLLTPIQRFVTRWVGRETAAAVEAHSRAWLVQCPNCGFERSIWEIGGIRYKAAGSPRMRMRCPRCGQAGWHEVHKAANFPAGDVPAWPIIRLILAVLLALLILGALIAGLVLKLTGGI